MEYDDIAGPFKDTIEELKLFVENELEYNKLLWIKRIGELSSYLLLLVLLMGFGSFVLLFISFAFAGWFGEITHLGIGTGYISVAIFYALLGLIVYKYRQKLIFNPSRKILGNIFFDDDESSKGDFNFESKEAINGHLKRKAKELNEQKQTLNEKINALGNSITLKNVTQQILGHAYDSIMTTSNIAMFTFNMVKKIKTFTERKNKKKSKKKLKK